MPFALILTIVFFAVILFIAIKWTKKSSSVDDFFLGGKTLGPWILAISYGTAYFSAVIFVGFAGQFGWQFGFNALWVGIGNAIIGGLLAWVVLGKRTRRMTHNLNAMTMPEFFSARYETNGLKIVTAILIFIFLVPYTASVYKGLSYIFEITLERKISFEVILTSIMVVSLLYVTLGGYKAVARIDFILGGIMFFGSLLMVLFVVQGFGGIGEVFQSVPENLQRRLELPDNRLESITPLPWFVLPSVIFMTSFGVWGMPQMVHKYYAINDEKQIVRGAIITTVFALVIGCSAYFVGSTTLLMEPQNVPYKNAAGKTLSENDIESILLAEQRGEIPEKQEFVVNVDHLVPDLLMAKLPSLLMALILLLVLSASMSTLSSLVLVSASAITIDLYKGYLNPKASERQSLFLMRGLCALFIFISYLIALSDIAWIATLMSISWGAVAGSFLAPYIYGLFWKRTTKLGAYAGMWTGLLVSNGLYWYWVATIGPKEAGKLVTVAASLAMVLPFIVVPIVSMITKPPKEETVKKAFESINE